MKAITRKSTKSKATKGNARKHDNYKEAFARIKAAIDQNFFIEAVAIQEAIISDRLRSHLGYHKKLPTNDTFYSLLQEWKALNGAKHTMTASIDLPELIDLWRQQRNSAVHEFIARDSDVEAVLKKAKVAAMTGLKLTRALCDWHGKQVRQARKKMRESKKK